MQRIWAITLGMLLLLTGCLRPPGLLDFRASTPGLTGQALWGESYATQATTTEIAQGATVSLIEPTTGNTVATTLTQPNGSFSMSFGRWSPTPDQPYLLEAIKGLAAGGSPNRAGAPAARIRTLVSRVSGTWTSLTGATIQITRGTTALCVVASLRGLTASQQQALMGKLTPNSGPPETYAATTDLPSADYTAVWNLVNTALSANQDPLRVIARNVSTGTYTRLERGPTVTDLSANSAQAGDTLILYGNGFDPLSSNNKVYFNGIQALTVTVNGTGTQLTVTIPDDATSGPLTVKVGNLVMLAASTFAIRGSTVLTVAGLNVPISGQSATSWYVSAPQDVAADGSGNLYVISSHQVLMVSPDGTFVPVAGQSAPGFGGEGGPAVNSRLNNPKSLAVDSAGNLYIDDQYNNRIRMIPRASGTYFGRAMTANYIYTIAGNGQGGYGGDGGLATSAVLSNPDAVAVDADGNVFIADYNRIRMVAKTTGTTFGLATTANYIYTIAGNGGAAFNGNGLAATSASFGEPTDLALDAAGNLFIFTPYDELEGYDDEWGEYYWYTGYSPRLRMVPRTTGSYFGQAMTANSIYTVAGNGGSGFSADGTAATSALLQAYYFSLDGAGNLLIADGGNNRVRMVPRTGGSYFGRTMTANAIYTIAGTGTAGFSGDGSAAIAATIAPPTGTCVDTAGNLYLADSGNNRIRVVAKNASTSFGQAMVANAIYTVAGNGTSVSTFTGDGGPAANAKLNGPYATALDANGNLYFTDRSYHRVRMIPKTSGTYFGQAMTANNIYTLAGTGVSGFSGDSGPATSAKLSSPGGIALDSAGNLFVLDNNRVRMIVGTAGTYFGQALLANNIYTIAGTGGYGSTGDGGAAISATLAYPKGIALDGSGNLYLADSGNNRVRMIVRTAGTYFGQALLANNIYTVAGNGSTTFNGNGTAAASAAFAGPTDVAVDSAGNLYFATALSDYGDYDSEGYWYTITYDSPCVRMVPKVSGTYFGQAMTANCVYTVAGYHDNYGYSGDGGPATSARLKGELHLALDLSGNLYIVDQSNHRIRMVPRSGGRRYGRLMSANYIYTILGTATAGYNGDGDASVVSLNSPTGVVVGPSELYVADTSNNLVRKVY